MNLFISINAPYTGVMNDTPTELRKIGDCNGSINQVIQASTTGELGSSSLGNASTGVLCSLRIVPYAHCALPELYAMEWPLTCSLGRAAKLDCALFRLCHRSCFSPLT